MKTNILKYITVTFILLVAYANCARFTNLDSSSENETVSPSTCTDCDTKTVFLKPSKKIENIDGENLNVRQFSESAFSLLGQRADKIAPIYLDVLVSEKEARRPLLPQLNQISTVNSMGVLSQASLAGQICRVFIANHADSVNGGEKGTPVPFFEAINWTKNPELVDKTPQLSELMWIASFEKMTLKMWGRALKSEEKTAAVEFVKTAMAESLTSNLKANTEGGGNSLQSINMGIMLCTAALVAPESGLL